MAERKKTVGIVTFNRATNFGAVLQSYALKCVCEQLGYEAHVVDYKIGKMGAQPAPVKNFIASKNKVRSGIRMARGLLGYPWDNRRWQSFSAFRKKYLSESKECCNPKDLKELGYDAYILGSDQIWNYRITGGKFDPVFFGNITGDSRKVIYAASSQDVPFPLDMEKKLKQCVELSPAKISIRETVLADYVYRLTGKAYPVVADPTILAGREIMEKIVPENKEKKPYILIYQIDRNISSDIAVKTLEKRFGCKVYTMTVPRIGSLSGRRGDCGPEQFLSLLKNAEFLVTNSFHGIALSLLFEKQFYVYENGGVMSRIDNLLEQVGLNDRKVRMVHDIDLARKINYTTVNKKLSELQKESLDYLKNALDGRQIYRQIEDHSDQLLVPLRQREKKDCSGCTACAEICPVHAIAMTADSEGFLYPVINEEICIHCGLCDRVCGFKPAPVNSTGKFVLPKAFGIKHKDYQTRFTSRSGAAFVAFSDYILANGGVVYGAVLQDDLTVKHMRAVTKEDRDRMKTAKYVQSNLAGIIPQVIEDLKNGMPVLFSGTPCQISGLHAALETKKIGTEELVTCDLVCHGVPSPEIWKQYTDYIEKKAGEKIRKASFRDKEYGWDTHFESFELESGKKIVSRDYTDLFYEHIMFRPSCHNCHFSNVNRAADISLADFWGIEKNDASFNDNKGVSLVLINTEKGAELLDHVKEELDYFQCDLDRCIQPTLVKPSTPSARREDFWTDYREKGFEYTLKKYTTPVTTIKRCKKAVKKILYRVKLRSHP